MLQRGTNGFFDRLSRPNEPLLILGKREPIACGRILQYFREVDWKHFAWIGLAGKIFNHRGHGGSLRGFPL